MDKIYVTSEEMKALCRLVNLADCAVQDDGIVLVQGEDGTFDKLDTEHLQKTMQGIFDRIEVREEHYYEQYDSGNDKC